MAFIKSLKSIFSLRCPNCREGKLFVSPVNQFKDLFEMNKSCPNCGQAFFLEVGFYWGAMYMAYSVNSALCFILFAIGFWGFGWTIGGSFVFLSIILILISPYIFRLSRSIWLHIFVRPKIEEKNV
ncbi:MAG: DUF983 domain-containing protein [Bacteroidota bacterium]